ncbi:Midasin, partial [Caligus rogercresseyi]
MYKIEEILLRGSGSTLESVVEAHGPCIHPLLSSLKPASEYSIEVNEGILHLIAEICSSISSSSWKYALQYFSPKFPPFGRFLRFSQGNFPKRRKIQKSSISDESMAWATLTLVQSDPFFRDLWDWSSLSTVHPSISDNLSEKTGWLLQRTFSILLDLNPGLITSSHVHFSPPPMPSIPYNSSGIVMPQENLAQIQGISLKGSLTPDPAFVLLPSRTSFLQSICLAVSSGSPCLLSGPTGSGKTRLVEHLARRLSKRKFFDFNSVRLNDQTDGRALIGGYVCTQVPGQFLWKRGILTKAFLEGDWLLVEDAGKASPDVKSLLTQIIETRSLYISHFGRSFKAAPGFQLFLTATSSREDELLGLDSSPYHIPLSDFSFSDTSAIIDSLFAQKLGEGTCFKLVKTYEIVSKMDAMSRIRRILSLRDLLKWCGRIFSLNDREDVFFNGIDALCQWIPDKHVQLEACHVIGRFVNFNQDEISHLLKKHHPRLLPSKEHLQSPNAKIDSKFALTRSSSNLLEFLSCAVGLSEPVLLIGETGYLCSALGKTLRVVNMSQQSDNSDLLGAYKPVDTGIIVMATRKMEENRKFLRNVSLCVQGKSWSKAIALFAHVCDNALKFLASENNPLTQKWKKLQAEIKGIQKSLSSNVNIMFSFVKGVLSEALESGEWILLDEINLAEPETLECLTDIISKENPEESVRKHPEFRVFACMNPPTDVGKSNLPSSLRNQFTEYFIHEPENENELIQIVSKYISDLNVEVETIQSIVNFYLMLKVNASKRLCAGNGAIPIFSLRTLCRAFAYPLKINAFSVCFLTELDKDSYQIVLRLLIKYLAGDKKGSKFLKEQIPKPIESKLLDQVGEIFPQIDDKYILTKSVRKNLKDISRIVSNCDLPVLIQGETSVGKTSLITYLANASGNRCYRINNHEHTDIQEYIGTYTMDDNEKWGLDYFGRAQLAPTEVLEALNRVLDDNRELFIAETQTIVKAHKNFRLFATQNPAGMYGGRKVLSRAFRNRFIQLNFDEVPTEEIEVIVEKAKMVKVMSELQALRRSSAAFEGKRGYITLRDLFRWGRRFNMAAQTMKSNDTFYDWNQHFAEEGYMVLVKKIEKIMKVSLKENEILSFTSEKHALATSCEQLFLLGSYEASGIVWTRNAQRMAILLLHALRFKEPVLLVGETGCGKTTIVQEVSHFLKKKLKIINCHLHTETSDFLGSLRPGREEGESLFQWADGPLIQTMKSGDLLLVDEISLADDSVIERMNSVLEPSRKLLLAEKASQGSAIEEITAKSSFQLIATMNPGGDFGKKELSPALRNRFFEVWCPCANRDEDLHILIRRSLEAQFISPPEYTLVRFLNWLKSASNLHLSIRDLMTWITFINKSQSALSNPNCSIVHGICLVLFDGYFMMNNLVQASTSDSFREDCKKFFQSSLQDHDPNCSCLLWIFSEGGECSDIVDTPSHFGIQPFVMPKTSFANPKSNFSFKNKTTAQNAFKLLRGFCLDKPMLLEGPPGVGKSSIVESLAALSGHQLVRINLSDQTEISDLFGTDLPIENLGDSSSKEQIFAWRDGPLLSALKDGHWILLDELNLATQSVLEGLNACLDHRGEIFIPELNKVFTIKKGLTKIFGCQNPFAEGGDRKGLPKSFLNRFVRVNVNALTNEDIWSICKIKFPSVSPEFVRNLISCLQDLKDAMRDSPFVGGPWSINLRDISRFLGAIESKNGKHSSHYVHHLFETIFVSRFRSEGDAEITRGIYNRFFPRISSRKVSIYMNTHNAFVGMCKVPRSRSYFTDNSLMLLPSQSKPLEHVMTCVENRLIPILVGEGSVGKSAIVKVAAQMTGAELVTVSLSAGCDTNDLLGGFEQTDIIQEIARVRNRLIKELKKMAAREDQFNNEADTLLTLVFFLFQILTELKNTGHASIHELIEREERDLLAKYERHGKNKFFKWIDSNLVQALIQGSWVLMDNANFCSSSVLDRLNGLLEDGGCLELYEHGLVDGSHRRITPHLDFRIFFTMNPRNGELSPAMRNRCVEIFLPPDTLDNDASKLSLSASIIGPELASALLLLNYSKDFNVMETSKCFKELLLNGWPLKESLAYMKNLVSKESRTNILQSQYHPQVISFESISSDPSYIIPMKQLEMLRNCIPNSNLVILFFLLFSSKDDLCIRLHLLGSSIDSTRLSSLLQDLDSLPLERRALLTYIQPEESSTITQVSVKLAFELTSIKVASLALPLNPSLELKNASGALQTFLSQTLAPECDLSGVSNENWNSFNLVFTYVEHMIRLIEESDSKSNPIAKLTILWIKLKSVLEALGLLNNSSFSLKCVDRHLTLHLENDHESIDRSVFMESTGQRGFLTVSELNGFSDMLKRNAVWTLEDDLSHLVTLRKTLQQAKNWFRLADHKSLIPNEGRFSPFFNYSLNAFNDSKLPGKEFLASVAMKWEEIQWGSKEASPCLLLNKMIFPETDDITLENFEDKCKELQNIQTQIADNYSLILRKNEEKNAVTLSRAKMICSVFSQELSSSLLFNEVQQIRELIPKAHDEEDILIHARLKML